MKKRNRSTRRRSTKRRARWKRLFDFLERLRLSTLAFSQRLIDQLDSDDRGFFYYVVLAIPFLLRALARPQKPQRRRRISKRVAKQPVRSLARRKFGAKRSSGCSRRH